MSLFRDIDRLLRGECTRPEDLREGRLELPVRGLLVACLLLGAVYGALMGLFAAANQGNANQVMASAVKVPLLFLLTLVVTFPSLYVFSALSRSRLNFAATLRLLLIAIAVNLAVLASFGPVTAFFTYSTSSYPFMKVLNVAFFGISGFIGLGFLWRALEPILGTPEPLPPPPPREGEKDGDAWSQKRLYSQLRPNPAKRVFTMWLVVYGMVGAQMGWLLRPFIGDPNQRFQWFRTRESNFLYDFSRTLSELFS